MLNITITMCHSKHSSEIMNFYINNIIDLWAMSLGIFFKLKLRWETRYHNSLFLMKNSIAACNMILVLQYGHCLTDEIYHFLTTRRHWI